jgi:hypothetical protein
MTRWCASVKLPRSTTRSINSWSSGFISPGSRRAKLRTASLRAMSIAQSRSPDLPGYNTPTFTLMFVGFTPHRSVYALGFDEFGRLTPIRRLSPLRVPRTSALTTGFLQIPSRLGHCLRLTFPLTGHVEDFHLRVCAPSAGRTKKKPLWRGAFTALKAVTRLLRAAALGQIFRQDSAGGGDR